MSEATKININDKPLVNSVSDNATVFISDGGKLKRVALSTLTGTGDTHRAISYDFSGMGNIDTVLPGERLEADDEGVVFDDIKKNDIIIDTYSGKIFECTHKDDGTDGEATLFMGDTIVCIALTGAQSSDSGESSGTAVTAYKKIGYTDDCDYIVASSTSALSVFQTAVSEASDGDTILVMPGTYSGATASETLRVGKNLTFVGILADNTNIKFAVGAGIEGYFDDSNGEFVDVVTHTVTFKNITFSKSVSTSSIYGWGEIYVSYLKFDGCTFSSGCTVDCYAGFFNCILDGINVMTSGYPGFGDGAKSFYDCKLIQCTFHANDVYMKRCKISLSSDTIYLGGFNANDCEITTLPSGLTIENDHDSGTGSVYMTNCVVYGDIIDNTSFGKFTNTYKRELGTLIS